MHRSMLFLMVSISMMFSQTEVSGNVSGNWSPDDSPYIVSNNIVLQPTDTLNIAPGTEIFFDGNYRFDVFGTLFAIGEADDMILFTRNASTNWMSINFSDQSNDDSVIDYAIIEYGSESGYDPYRGVVNCNLSSPTISNNLIQHNDDHGIYISGGSAHPAISGNTIYNNNSDGIYLDGANTDILIEDNVIQNNNYGLRTGYDCGNIMVIGNTITNNSSYGIYFESNANTTTIENNTILDNNYAGIYFGSNANTTTIENNTIEGNGSDGIYMDSYPYDYLINNNLISSNNSESIYIRSSSSGSIFNNIIINNQDGIEFSSSIYESVSVFDNTIDGNSNYGIYASSSSNNLIVQNNSVTNNNNGLYLNSCSSCTVEYNNSWGNSSSNYSGSLPTGSGNLTNVNYNGNVCDIYNNISENPLYVDTDNGNYLLQIASPNIDAGTPTVVDSDDTPSDIGALYFNQNTSIIYASESSIDFGQVTVGESNTAYVTISSLGSIALEVSGITSAYDSYSITPTEFTLETGETQELEILFTPDSNMNFDTELIIFNNSIDTPEFSISLSGSGYYPPSINIYPTEINVTMLQGQSMERNFSINNSGTDPLNWFINFPQITFTKPPNDMGTDPNNWDILSDNVALTTSCYDYGGGWVECYGSVFNPFDQNSWTNDYDFEGNYCGNNMPCGTEWAWGSTRQIQDNNGLGIDGDPYSNNYSMLYGGPNNNQEEFWDNLGYIQSYLDDSQSPNNVTSIHLIEDDKYLDVEWHDAHFYYDNGSFSYTRSNYPAWLNLSSQMGSTNGGFSEEIVISFDSSNLEPGEYSTELIIESNDPYQSEISVPISLTVFSDETSYVYIEEQQVARGSDSSIPLKVHVSENDAIEGMVFGLTVEANGGIQEITEDLGLSIIIGFGADAIITQNGAGAVSIALSGFDPPLNNNDVTIGHMILPIPDNTDNGDTYSLSISNVSGSTADYEYIPMEGMQEVLLTVITSPPEIVGLADMYMLEGSTTSLGFSINDEGGSGLTLEILEAPEYVSFEFIEETNTGIFTISPEFGAMDGYVQLSVTNSEDIPEITLADFSIYINHYPVFNQTDDIYVLENESVTYPVSLSDEDGDNTFLSLVSAPEYVFFTPIDDSIGLIEINTFADYVSGEVVFNISDDGNPNAVSTVSFSVINNHAPELPNFGDFHIPENHILDTLILFTDIDGDPISYEVVDSPDYISWDYVDDTGLVFHFTPDDSDMNIYDSADPGDDGGDEGDAPIQLSFINDDGNSFDVYMENSVPVAGFQMDFIGGSNFSILSATGGTATEAGMFIQFNSSFLLGMDFNMGSIPAGEGILFHLEYSGSTDALSLEDCPTCAGWCSTIFSDYYGDCVDWGFAVSSSDDSESCGEIINGCDLPVDHILLNSDGSVVYNASSNIGGFQFTVDGADINNAWGGDAGEAGMSISAQDNSVMGFSFTGGSFGPCGTMVNLDLSGDPTGLSGIVISNAIGLEIDFTYYYCDDRINRDADVLTLRLTDPGGMFIEETVEISIYPTYYAGDTRPLGDDLSNDGDSDDAGEFGDDMVIAPDVINALKIATGAPDVDIPHIDSDLYNAFDSSPADIDLNNDNDSYDLFERGGDGFIEASDVILSLKRATMIEGYENIRRTALAYPHSSSIDDSRVIVNREEANDTLIIGNIAGIAGEIVEIPVYLLRGEGSQLTGMISGFNLETNQASVQPTEPMDFISNIGGSAMAINSGNDYLSLLLMDVDIEQNSEVLIGHITLQLPSNLMDGDYYRINGQSISGTSSSYEVITINEGIGGSVTIEVQQTINQQLNLNALQVNLMSTHVAYNGMAVSEVLADIDLLMCNDDNGNYYAPSFGVNQIGEYDIAEGYYIFLDGMDNQVFEIEGTNQSDVIIALNALQVNLIPYLLEECMAIEEIFEGIVDDILIVQDDNGRYYVPSFGVMSLTEMCPGEAYEIFLMGMDDIEFQYPQLDGLARTQSESSIYWEEYVQSSKTLQYDFKETGISHPVIITHIEGEVEIGDELVAYAHGEVVGASRIIDLDSPIVIAAWGSFREFGADLPGYDNGDAIELRLWSENEQSELLVISDLDVGEFGNSPLSAGTAIAYNKLAVPVEFTLSPAYPNPFNPTTTISFAIPAYAQVSIAVYNLQGREVVSLANGSYDAGYHQVIWNADSHSTGVYFVKMVAGSYVNTQKLMLVK